VGASPKSSSVPVFQIKEGTGCSRIPRLWQHSYRSKPPSVSQARQLSRSGCRCKALSVLSTI